MAIQAAQQYHPLTTVTAASLKGEAGSVVRFVVTNDNAAVRWFQIHDKATAPVAGEAPVQSWKIPAGTATVPGYVEQQMAAALSLGVAVAISTTRATFTDAATSTEHTVHVEYN